MLLPLILLHLLHDLVEQEVEKFVRILVLGTAEELVEFLQLLDALEYTEQTKLRYTNLQNRQDHIQNEATIRGQYIPTSPAC